MKVARFQKILKNKGIDFALISNLQNKDPNMLYFIGLDIDFSFLLIPKKGNSVLLTNKLEFERAKRCGKIKNVRLFEKPAFDFIAKIVNRRGSRIGINKSVISLNAFGEFKKHFKNKKYIDISQHLVKHRQTKEKDEITKIKKACSITDKIFSRLIADFSFKTEMDIERFLGTEAMEHGCTMSFPPIVASGFGASMPHYRAKNIKLRKGFLILDFGVNYKGYMSDMTRTIYIGNPRDKEEQLYDLLKKVQEKAIRKARPGMKVAKLMESVQKSLGRYNENFIHGLGHGIGIEIHELPSIHAESKDVFCIGDCFTIEPGIYFPGHFGIRIEDDILLTKKGSQILTKSSKKLISVQPK